MAVITAENVSYRYGGVVALKDVSFEVPEGALYALLGPNGSGKTTLLQILAGLRRADSGRAAVRGRDSARLRAADLTAVTYMAEGQPLPGWMTLAQLESYLAPLYPGWDRSLAGELRTRFRLDAGRKLKALSRGEQTKAALLCALAPRPRLVLLDEPFTGLDVGVKDEIVSGLLESAGTEGWTIMLASHDLAELELLADWVGLLADGRLWLSEPIESVRARFRRIDVVLGDDVQPHVAREWLAVRHAGRRLCFLSTSADDEWIEAQLRSGSPGIVSFVARPAALKDVFLAVTGGTLSAEQAHAVRLDTAPSSGMEVTR